MVNCYCSDKLNDYHDSTYILHDTTNDQIKSFQGEIQGESHTVSVKPLLLPNLLTIHSTIPNIKYTMYVYVVVHLVICNTDRPYDTLPTLVPLE